MPFQFRLRPIHKAIFYTDNFDPDEEGLYIGVLLGLSASDQESEGVSVSYTMGGTSIKAAFNETNNVAGVATTDRDSYEIALVFAF